MNDKKKSMNNTRDEAKNQGSTSLVKRRYLLHERRPIDEW